MPATILPWTQYTEAVVGRGHPTLADTDNRALRQMLSGSGYAVDAVFPGVYGPVYNVKAFGAVGDGTTDDTVAIQATITAAVAANGTVYVPRAIYRVTPGVTWAFDIEGPVAVVGEPGATFQLATALAGGEIVRVNGNPGGGQVQNVTIIGLTFDANGMQTGTGLRLFNTVNCLIRNCRFTRFGSASSVSFSYAIRSEGNVGSPANPFVWAASAPASFSRNNSVQFCQFDSFTGASPGSPPAIFFYENDGGVAAFNTMNSTGIGVNISGPNRRIQVIGNGIEDMLDSGIRVEVDVFGDNQRTREHLIANNTIRNCVKDGIRLNGAYRTLTVGNIVSYALSGIASQFSSFCTVANNIVSLNTNRGIFFLKDTQVGSGSHDGPHIIGNRCEENAGDGILVQGGSQSGSIPATSVLIQDNTVRLNGNGIELDDGDSRARITNNFCDTNGTGGGSLNAGIVLTSKVLDWGGATVSFNRCADKNSSPSGKQVAGLWCAATAGRTLGKCYAYFNDFSDTPNSAVYFGSSINTTTSLGGTVAGQYLRGTLYRNSARGVNAAAVGVNLSATDIVVEDDESGVTTLLNGLTADNPTTLTDAATVVVDATKGNYFRLTATAGVGATRVMGAPTGLTIGQVLVVEFVQDGTGGRALTWNAVYKQAWSDTGNTANKRSTVRMRSYDGTNLVQDGAQGPYV